jgi:hypothetical protein
VQVEAAQAAPGLRLVSLVHQFITPVAVAVVEITLVVPGKQVVSVAMVEVVPVVVLLMVVQLQAQ